MCHWGPNGVKLGISFKRAARSEAIIARVLQIAKRQNVAARCAALRGFRMCRTTRFPLSASRGLAAGLPRPPSRSPYLTWQFSIIGRHMLANAEIRHKT